MKNAEYVGNDGFLQRESVEHEEYAGAHSTEQMEAAEQDNASDLMEKILNLKFHKWKPADSVQGRNTAAQLSQNAVKSRRCSTFHL